MKRSQSWAGALLVLLTLAACDAGRSDEQALESKEESTASVPREESREETIGDSGVQAECRVASDDCPVTEGNSAGVISTDSQPLGSTVQGADENKQTPSESDYPTSVGSGSAGSGITGTPTGPASGPTTGIGR